MNLQRSPNRWSCLITSAAMILDTNVEVLIEELGHDGSEILWPKLPDPQRRRSFHIQEIIDLAINRDVWLTPIEAQPMSLPSPRGIEQLGLPIAPYRVEMPSRRLNSYLKYRRAILIGQSIQGRPHSVAWDGQRVFDPIGEIVPIELFSLQTAWIV